LAKNGGMRGRRRSDRENLVNKIISLKSIAPIKNIKKF
jgi:hypothetical protein